MNNKSVIAINYAGKETIYPSIKAAAEDLGMPASHICMAAKGKLKYTGGFRFMYKNDN